MKLFNRIVIFILPIVLLTLSCKDNSYSSLPAIVKAELGRYPGQRLIDIYKTFFQGFFGPAHLITDVNIAAKYTKAELAEANDLDSVLYHYLPPDGKFVRVYLRLIKDGKISSDDFTAAFVKSAKPVSKSDIEKWKKKWPEILSEIEKQKPDMPNFQEDRALIEDLLAKDEYAADHSDEFIEKYHPHYRVISAEQMRAIEDKKAKK